MHWLICILAYVSVHVCNCVTRAGAQLLDVSPWVVLLLFSVVEGYLGLWESQCVLCCLWVISAYGKFQVIMCYIVEAPRGTYQQWEDPTCPMLAYEASRTPTSTKKVVWTPRWHTGPIWPLRWLTRPLWAPRWLCWLVNPQRWIRTGLGGNKAQPCTWEAIYWDEAPLWRHHSDYTFYSNPKRISTSWRCQATIPRRHLEESQGWEPNILWLRWVTYPIRWNSEDKLLPLRGFSCRELPRVLREQVCPTVRTSCNKGLEPLFVLVLLIVMP